MRNSFPVEKFKYLLLITFLLVFINPAYSNISQPEDSIFFTQKTLSAEDLIRGERLFFGLVYLENKSVNCASCHNVRDIRHLELESGCS